MWAVSLTSAPWFCGWLEATVVELDGAVVDVEPPTVVDVEPPTVVVVDPAAVVLVGSAAVVDDATAEVVVDSATVVVVLSGVSVVPLLPTAATATPPKAKAPTTAAPAIIRLRNMISPIRGEGSWLMRGGAVMHWPRCRFPPKPSGGRCVTT